MSVTQLTPLTPLLAVVFGLLSFVSPCCLPLLPAYLGLIAGGVRDSEQPSQPRSVWLNGLGFVAGLSAVFALLGASASAIGNLLFDYRPILMEVGGALIVIFGLQALGVLRLGRLAQSYGRMDMTRFSGRAGPFGAMLVGAAFGLGWTPCVGLFLGSLLTLAAQENTVAQGAFLLLLYGLGLGIPFLAAGLATDRLLRWTARLRPHLAAIERGGGAVLVGMGLLLFTGQLTLINSWAIRTFGLGLTF